MVIIWRVQRLKRATSILQVMIVVMFIAITLLNFRLIMSDSEQDTARLLSNNYVSDRGKNKGPDLVTEQTRSPPNETYSKTHALNKDDRQEIDTNKEKATTSLIIPTLTLPRPHPHAGARYANGTFGYIADPTLVRRNYLKDFYESESNRSLHSYLKLRSKREIRMVCNKPPGKGAELEGYNIVMKVVVNASDPIPDNVIAQESSVPIQRKSQAPKILCAVYTHEANHDRIQNIIDTWGWRCDGFIAASTMTDETLGVLDLSHLGPETYKNMWQKVRSLWFYVSDNYIDDYDFFWIGGDDVQLIPENLRNYLWSLRDSNSCVASGWIRTHKNPSNSSAALR